MTRHVVTNAATMWSGFTCMVQPQVCESSLLARVVRKSGISGSFRVRGRFEYAFLEHTLRQFDARRKQAIYATRAMSGGVEVPVDRSLDDAHLLEPENLLELITVRGHTLNFRYACDLP